MLNIGGGKLGRRVCFYAAGLLIHKLNQFQVGSSIAKEHCFIAARLRNAHSYKWFQTLHPWHEVSQQPKNKMPQSEQHIEPFLPLRPTSPSLQALEGCHSKHTQNAQLKLANTLDAFNRGQTTTSMDKCQWRQSKLTQ